MQNAGIVVDDGATLVNLRSFNVFSGGVTWAEVFPVLITLIAVFVIGALSKKKVKGSVLWGMLGGAILYYIIGFITVPGFYETSVAPNLSSEDVYKRQVLTPQISTFPCIKLPLSVQYFPRGGFDTVRAFQIFPRHAKNSGRRKRSVRRRQTAFICIRHPSRQRTDSSAR